MPDYMEEALALARKGFGLASPNPMVGAVIVRDCASVGRGWNRVTSTNDPTAHAEIEPIRDACRAVGTFALAGCEIYSSCEPCPMCFAAIYWARLERVYYAADGHDARAVRPRNAR